MKNVIYWLIPALLVLTAATGRAQAPAWQLAEGLAGGNGRVAAMATDAAGNVYVTGAYSGTVTFGGVSLTSNAGASEVFVAKWNPATNRCLWARSARSTGQMTARALAVSGSAVYVAGDFQGTATFGGVALASAGSNDIFISKLTDAGNTGDFTWAQRAGGASSSDLAYGLAAEGSSVYVVGRFASTTATFGSISLSNAASSGSDAFVAKLTDAGPAPGFVWAQRLGGAEDDEARAVACQGGAVYFVGHYRAALLGPGSGLQSVDGTTDAFVAKVTDAGGSSSVAWVSGGGGSSVDQALAVTASSTGIYVSGFFSSSMVQFGPMTTRNSSMAATADAFLLKLTDEGSGPGYSWLRQSYGNGTEMGSALAVRGQRVYMAGSFGDSQTGNVSTAFVGNSILPNAGLRDVFVACLLDGAAPSFTWSRGAGGAGNDDASSVVLSGTGVYVGGSAVAPASFAPLTLTGAATGPTGYLASLNDLTLSTTPGQQPDKPSLYPNPARHTAALRFPSGLSAVSATLTDVLGRTLRQQPVTGTSVELDLRGLAPGLYQVRVQAGGQQLSQRLVVE